MVEACDTSVSVDLLVRSLFAIGATRADLAKVLAHNRGFKAPSGYGAQRRQGDRRTAPFPARSDQAASALNAACCES